MVEAYIWPLLGGVLIGLASGGLYLLAGEIAGVTGILRTAMKGPVRTWCLTFLAGCLVAGLIWNQFFPASFALAGIERQTTLQLVLAGLLVGIGTDLGNGCTSGHGVCGLSRLSKRSLVAVLVFMAAAVLTVFTIRHGGVL